MKMTVKPSGEGAKGEDRALLWNKGKLPSDEQQDSY
jgi:hypothetical protein